MTITKAQFIWGLRQQESDGNYSASNPSGAEGAYQILASNIPTWTKEALGHADTTAQFLASPTDQDATADKIAGDLYDQYGPEKAAAAWYSGNPDLYQDPAPQNGGPSVEQYVQDVMANAAKAPAGVSLPLTLSSAVQAITSGTEKLAGSTSSDSGGLLSFPSEIVGFFTDATDDMASAASFFAAFTQTSTWVRVGAGIAGSVFVALGIVALVLSGK